MPPLSLRPRGLTLVELLVVIAVVGALVALLLPAIQAARESARRTDCQSRLRQLAIALAQHESEHRQFPAGCLGCRFEPGAAPGSAGGQRFLAWSIPLLPYLGQANVKAGFDLEQPSYKSPNKEQGSLALPEFLCPSTPAGESRSPGGLWRDMAFTDYAGTYGVEGPGRTNESPQAVHWLEPKSLGVMLYERPTRAADIRDGLAFTTILGELRDRRAPETEWANGHNVFAQEAATPINGRPGLGNELGSPHAGGAAVAFCDGHVEFLSDGIDQAALNALFTRAGADRPPH